MIPLTRHRRPALHVDIERVCDDYLGMVDARKAWGECPERAAVLEGIDAKDRRSWAATLDGAL